MPIDIDRLTEAELVDLNRRVVERLKFLSQMRAHAQMLDFSIGDRVSFSESQPDAVALPDPTGDATARCLTAAGRPGSRFLEVGCRAEVWASAPHTASPRA